MQMQRKKNKLISSKVQQGQSPQAKEASMFNFLSFPDLGSPRRNLAKEIDEMQKLKDDLTKLSKDQLIERIEKMNDEHRKTVASLKNKYENDIAISQALSKTTVDKYTAEIAKMEKQIKQHQVDLKLLRQAHNQEKDDLNNKLA